MFHTEGTFPENEHDTPAEALFGLVEPSFDKPISKESITETLNKALPPRGTYSTNPEEFGPMNLYKASKDFDEERRMLILSGRVTGTFKGQTVTTFIRNVKLSPDLRKAKEWGSDGNGGRKPTGNLLDKDDGPSVKWAQAVRAYERTYKEMPKTEQQVVDFLAAGEYKLKVRPFNGELYVGDILAKNERG